MNSNTKTEVITELIHEYMSDRFDDSNTSDDDGRRKQHLQERQ